MNAPAAIPRIIHQTWKTEEIPYHHYDRRWVESWTRLHPDWLYVLWSDRRLRELTRSCYPDFEIMCGSDVPGIFLADFGRYAALHQFGGLYVDLDYECLKNMEPLLAGHEFVTSYSDPERTELNNALIASRAGHPLLLRYMEACRERWPRAVADHWPGEPLSTINPDHVTGPQMITAVTAEYLAAGGEPVMVHDARLLCPIDWRSGLSIHRKTLPAEVIDRVREDYPDAYAATYWSHIRE